MATDLFDAAVMKAELLRDEGLRDEVYKDTRGFMTVGIGHNLSIPQNSFTTDALYENDLNGCIASLDLRLAWWRKLDPVRQRVLINMMFNLGGNGLLKFPRFLAAMQAGQWGEAADQMMNSEWAREVGARATRLRALVLGQDADATGEEA